MRNILSLIGLFVSLYGYGQGCCSGGTPLSSNLGLQNIETKELHFQLAYNYNLLRDVAIGAELIEDENVERQTNSYLWRTSYAFSERFSVVSLLTYIEQRETVNSALGNNTNATTGLGDAVISFQYRWLAKNDKIGILSLGTKLPVGETDKRDDNGILFNANLQPGTGAWDGLLGFYFQQNHLWIRNLTFSALGTYRVTTEFSRYNEQQAYEFGDVGQLFFGFSHRWVSRLGVIDPAIMFRYRFTLPDITNNFDVPNTGGHWGFIVPNFTVHLNPKLSLAFSAELPIYRNLTGIQLTTSVQGQVTLNYRLGIQESPTPTLEENPSEPNIF